LTRTKASLLQLLLSVLIGIGVFALLYGLCYPGALFKLLGGDRLVLLIVAADLVVAPLLTLLLFRPGKAGLAFDMACISALRVALLGLGLWTAMQARPVYIVFSGDRLVIVPALALDASDLALALPQYRTRPLTGPILVHVEPPQDSDERLALLDSALQGKDIERYPKYYRDPVAQSASILAQARPVSLLEGLNGAASDAIARLQQDPNELVYLPATYADIALTAILDRSSGELLTWLDHDPWSTAANDARLQVAKR
jgi:hypothetical protein